MTVTMILLDDVVSMDVGHLGGPITAVLLLLLCVLCVGLFSSSEAALISVNKLRIRALAEKGHRGAAAVERLVAHHDRLFSTILTTENMFVILASSFAGAVATRYFGAIGAAVAAVVMTIFIVIFGEIVPKTLAARHAERVSLMVARPMEAITRIMAPVVWIFSAVARFLVRLTGTRGEADQHQLSEDEIKLAVKQGALEHDEKELIHTIFEFGDTVAHEVMVPRVDMVCIEAKAPLRKALELINQTGHSRLPVYGENIDDVVGILYAKDLLLKADQLASTALLVKDVMREKRVFVPLGLKIVELLSKLQAERSSMAIVIDEYGGTAGLVTIEMLLEEIVGEIEDEFDIEKAEGPQEGQIRQLDARTPVSEVNDEFNLQLPEGDYNSLGGFITHTMGKIPSQGEELEYEGVRFIVSKTHQYKLRTITVVLPDPAPAPLDGKPA
ncbi:MAG: hemolysin family protein [Candidatus Xenobia bacterium]